MGAAKEKIGESKKVAGRMTGDEKLTREGQSDEPRGKAQNMADGLTNALREWTDRSSS